MVDLPELAFEEKTHTYRLNGIEIPSVSKIIEPLSSAEYGTIDATTLKMAAYRGTAVHQAIESFLREGIDNDILPEFGNYYSAFKKWYTANRPHVEGIESRVYHKVMRYGGTADLICKVGKSLTLVDFKTSSKIVEHLVKVQSEAYSRAFQCHGVKIDAKIVVHLKKDGTVSVKELPLVDTESWTVFGSLMNVYSFLEKNN